MPNRTFWLGPTGKRGVVSDWAVENAEDASAGVTFSKASGIAAKEFPKGGPHASTEGPVDASFHKLAIEDDRTGPLTAASVPCNILQAPVYNIFW
jgi:hypothetical protein